MQVTLSKPYVAFANAIAKKPVKVHTELQELYGVFCKELLRKPDVEEGKNFPLIANGNIQAFFLKATPQKKITLSNIDSVKVCVNDVKHSRRIVFHFSNKGKNLEVEDSARAGNLLMTPTDEHISFLRDVVEDIQNRKRVYFSVGSQILKKTPIGTYHSLAACPNAEVAVTLKNKTVEPNIRNVDTLAIRTKGEGTQLRVYNFTENGTMLKVLRGMGVNPLQPPDMQDIGYIKTLAEQLKRKAG
jgi:hypothetical protein